MRGGSETSRNKASSSSSCHGSSTSATSAAASLRCVLQAPPPTTSTSRLAGNPNHEDSNNNNNNNNNKRNKSKNTSNNNHNSNRGDTHHDDDDDDADNTNNNNNKNVDDVSSKTLQRQQLPQRRQQLPFRAGASAATSTTTNTAAAGVAFVNGDYATTATTSTYSKGNTQWDRYASLPNSENHEATVNDDHDNNNDDHVNLAASTSTTTNSIHFDVPIPAKYVAETNLPTELGHFRLRAYRIPKQHRRDTAAAAASSTPFHYHNEFVGHEPCVIYASEHPPPACFTTTTSSTGIDSVDAAINTKIIMNNNKNNDQEKKEWAYNVPVRIHDQCLTSEVFGSQRCDCKEQLKMSLEYIQQHGGIIIYLQQEGRGIGLANKVAAYALQDDGMDTVDANLHLGFPEDCRQYGAVPSILHDLGIASVQLLTNNPRKVRRLKALGVDITATLPMVVPNANPHNRKYLETKQNRMNHKNFGDMLNNNNNSNDNVINGNNNNNINGRIMPGTMPLSKRNSGKNQQPLIQKVAESYINDGEEMAAHAIQVSLATTPTTTDTASSSLNVEDEEQQQEGVIAADDGYCFGKQSVIDAITAMAQGQMVVVVDDMNRENEGDLIMAADLCTPQDMARIVRYSSGVVCIAMEGSRMDELNLPPMVINNEDPKGTAFTVSVDAAKHHGITTGISASDRSKTVQLLANPTSTSLDFNRPGHIFPLRAREGGVLVRDGHTEASVDLSRLAGRSPCGILCEIVSDDDPTGMARLPELKRFCQTHGLVMTSIVDIAQYRRETGQ